MIKDRRSEFMDEPWQQGRLLITTNVRSWRPDAREEAQRREETMLFARFTSFDEGRGRELLFVFDNAADCAECVREHNVGLKKT